MGKNAPIRFVHAKTAHKVAHKVAQASLRQKIRDHARRIREEVDECFREELHQLRSNITCAYLSGGYSFDYSTPTHLSKDARHLLGCLLTNRLTKNGYNVHYSGPGHLSITW